MLLWPAPRTQLNSEIELRIRDENAEEEHVARLEEYKRRQEESKLKSQQDSKKRRLDQIPSGDNYINVPYSPYEWLREVKTEYYYRYEGSQMVPPCYQKVHYRVMKDPIVIHPIQLKELERLLAWRIAPKGSEFNECQRDTAGVDRPVRNGDAVDLNRPLQRYSNIHRKVFCECNDWDSKFQEDIDWCELDKETRWYDQPYNFPSNSFKFDLGGSFHLGCDNLGPCGYKKVKLNTLKNNFAIWHLEPFHK